MEAIEKLVHDVASGKPVQVGRYRLTRKLGEGAFAYVFEGSFDEFGRRKAAIKFPKQEQAKANIRMRQRILSALGNCPYAPNLIDQGDHAGTIYVAEELREQSLADLIAANQTQNKQPSPNEIVTLAGHLLNIDYFHRLKETDPQAAKLLGIDCLVHNDVKPSNILKMIDPTGDVVWQYTDFGIQSPDETATQNSDIQLSFVSAASLNSIRSIDEKLGKDIYAAPEVRHALLFGQTPPATVTADLWSIGAVLFKYATGKTPTWGQTDPCEHRKDIPEALALFFGKLLDGDPNKRYQSAREARNDLENIVSGKWCDSYIIGLARTDEGEYCVFKQPMRKGKPVGTRQTHDFTSKVVPPKILYVPDIQKTVVANAYTYSHDSIQFLLTLLDGDLHDSKHDWFRISRKYNTLLQYDVSALKNEKTGQLVMRMDVKHTATYNSEKTMITEVTDLAALPKNENVVSLDEKIKPGFFSSWKVLKQSRCSPDNSDDRVVIKEGKVLLPNRDAELPVKYVLDALWIPK